MGPPEALSALGVMRVVMPFGQDAQQMQLAAKRELDSINKVIGRHGLTLSGQDVQALAVGRTEALRISERVEFGCGVAKDLVLAFAGSPHLSQATFVDTVLELQALFYEVKNESLEQVADDELIAKMRSLFDEFADGNLDLLEEALFEGLARHVRDELVQPVRLGFHDLTTADRQALDEPSAGYEDAADPEADNAAANACTLAQQRFDVSKWVDDTYSEGWEGSSWLDE